MRRCSRSCTNLSRGAHGGVEIVIVWLQPIPLITLLLLLVLLLTLSLIVLLPMLLLMLLLLLLLLLPRPDRPSVPPAFLFTRWMQHHFVCSQVANQNHRP